MSWRVDLDYRLLKALVGSAPAAPDPDDDADDAVRLGRGERDVRSCLNAPVHMLEGQRVLDFGCGSAWSTAWLASHLPSSSIWGCDIQLELPARAVAWAAAQHHELHIVGSSSAIESAFFDSVISHDAFEHFADPGAILAEWKRLLKPGGRVFLAFGPLWGHPQGVHMFGTISRRKLPWLHLIFREEAVMRLWSEMSGIAPVKTHYAERPGGLNKMTVTKFRDLVAASGFEIETLTVNPVSRIWRVPVRRASRLMMRVPQVGELFSDSIQCSLRRPLESGS